MKKVQFSKMYLIPLFSCILLISTRAYSEKKNTDINELVHVSFKTELVKTILTSNLYPNDLACSLATRIKDEQVLMEKHYVNSISQDLVKETINLANEINEKCIVMDYFKKNILPIIKGGTLSATLDQDYELMNTSKLLRINLVNLKNDGLPQLKQCSFKGSIFTEDKKVIKAMTNLLECKINNVKISIRIMSSFSLQNTVSCVKTFVYLPEFIQPCKKLILSKDKQVLLVLHDDIENKQLRVETN